MQVFLAKHENIDVPIAIPDLFFYTDWLKTLLCRIHLNLEAGQGCAA